MKRARKETVTRTCYARVTFVFRALHERVPPVTRTSHAFYVEEFCRIFQIFGLNFYSHKSF